MTMAFCVTHVVGTREHRISPWFATSNDAARWIHRLDIWLTRQGGYITCNYRPTEGFHMPPYAESGYYVMHGWLARAGRGANSQSLLAGPFADTSSAAAAREWATQQATRVGLPATGDGYIRLTVEVMPLDQLPRGRFTPASNMFNTVPRLPGLYR